jgi:hypothetical protein
MRLTYSTKLIKKALKSAGLTKKKKKTKKVGKKEKKRG